VLRTFGNGTTVNAPDGTAAVIDTEAPTGWDTSIPLQKNTAFNAFGVQYTNVTSASATVRILGVNYKRTTDVAGGSGVLKDLLDYLLPLAFANAPMPHNTLKVFDITVSSDPLTVTFAGTPNGTQKTLSSGAGFVYIQDNLAHSTIKAQLTNLKWNHAADGCGCRPMGGQIAFVAKTGTTDVGSYDFDSTEFGTGCGSGALTPPSGAGFTRGSYAAPVYCM
jgi:hypothetical protein